MSTIRELLVSVFRSDTVDAIKRDGAGTEYDHLDVEVESAGFAATPGTAALQTSCRGPAIAWFKPAAIRRELLLCVDDTDGELWDMRLRELQQKEGTVYNPAYSLGGPRPHPMLVLVQTA